MPINTLQTITMDSVHAAPAAASVEWLWNGFLMPGDIALLTSQWKTGKTTLLSGLLRHLADGKPFLGRATRPARAFVVSEESHAQWGERLRLTPIGPHVELLARPFRGRPTPDEWELLIDRAIGAKTELFVVDPIASFLPGRSESEATSVLESLQPLLRMTAAGIAVLLLHHPRKKASEIGSSARGSGALLGFVDTSLELSRADRWDMESNRRLIRAQSRRGETPARLAYEWNRATGAFTLTADPRQRQFEENWVAIHALLKERTEGISSREVAEYWPDEGARPNKNAIYAWMNIAFDRKLVRREGQGTRMKPWRYRLENDNDRYRDELPPLEPLEPLRW